MRKYYLYLVYVKCCEPPAIYEDDDGLSDERKGENSHGRKRKNNLIVFSYQKIWTDSKAIEILENLKTGLNVIRLKK